MRSFGVIFSLFVALAVAAPAVTPEGALAQQSDRSSCGLSCACQDHQCVCAFCYPGGCNWNPNGKSC